MRVLDDNTQEFYISFKKQIVYVSFQYTVGTQLLPSNA